MTSVSLNELSDAVIDEFIAKFRQDLKQKPAPPARSPPRSSTIGPTPSKSVDAISKLTASDLPWTLETVFYQ